MLKACDTMRAPGASCCSSIGRRRSFDEETGEYTEDLAAQMLATTLGVEFDPNIAWKEREQVFKMAGKIVRTQNITQSAIGKPNRWTTVIALAVFIPEENISKRRR